eukprot:scaffold9483_cov93-Cylindrotheca_fusiformis.AAC.1
MVGNKVKTAAMERLMTAASFDLHRLLLVMLLFQVAVYCEQRGFSMIRCCLVPSVLHNDRSSSPPSDSNTRQLNMLTNISRSLTQANILDFFWGKSSYF